MMNMKMGPRRDCEEEGPILFAMQLVTASVLPAVLKVAIELDILELIKKKGPNAFISPAELAAQIPTTNPDAHKLLDRLLRVLAANSILHCTLKTLPDGRIERLYALAPVCDFFTKNDDGVSMAPMLLLIQDKTLMQTWFRLKDAFLEGGIPFNKEHGMTGFEYAAKDPRSSKILNEAMFNASTILMKRVLDIYDGFECLESLVDVGGGIGASLAMIVSKYPSIKAINFDLPHVIRDAPSYDGIEHMGGDMFVSMPKGDAIFMKWILHDWSDEECLKILKNCHKALPDKGKVIIAESILSDNPNKGVISDFHGDVIMFANTTGGKERTENEFEALAKQSGFKQFRKVCYALPLWIMEFCK